MFNRFSRPVRAMVIAGAGTALAIGLAACSGSSGSPSDGPASPTGASDVAPNTGPHNQADVTFAQGMIPHHEQAIEMSQLAASHTDNQAIRQLAVQIEAAQGPEIAEMRSWLSTWGASPMPTTGGHDMHGGMMPADGMMTPEQLAAMERVHGSAFDKMWLEMMIKHHEGAVAMARQELAEGENPRAKELAQAIIDGQTAEITQMRKMLAS